MKTQPRVRALVAVAATLLVGVLALPAAAGAKTTKRAPLTPGSRYLALGDSVTFGYEEATVKPAPNYKNAASFLGYPEQLGAALHVKVANAACPGETSASLINAKALSNGCENAPRNGPAYRKLFPLHVKYSGSQLAYALSYLKAHKNVRLVSLMIGANDYFLCAETTKDGCSSKAEVQAVVKRVSHNVGVILSAIRKKAHYKGQLAIVNYYSLNYASAIINAQSKLLNQTMDSAARPFHVVFADGYGQFKAAALHFGGNSCEAGLLTQTGGPGKCGVHPSYAGQVLLGQALAKVVRL